ncbi:glycosyltransferase family 4 protein [Chitinophaga sancti]|uniref:Glycosyltransferase family 4 protein n=2 Tax=Chitinophaga sancti TaxID=1004 RepID=A0ABZ0XMN5_9BACT|nr:glycosyltransferase family 4 protein [Chitinophaga sancti]WQD62926.1 glycosyltransferase family 4 protein [Chitinophaga sancti]WQG91449.1 glycosyltransferase family 4 protein [Chitinophaga sancti]
MSKRIIYLHQYFATPSMSGGTRSYDLSKKFLEQGHEVVMITSSAYLKNVELTGTWTVVNYEGIELHILKQEYSNKTRFSKRILIFLKFLLFATRRVLKVKGDVMLATSTPISIGVPALVKRLLHRTPFIFEVRDVWPEVPVAMGIIKNKLLINVLNAFEKHIYRKSTHIVALSSDMKDSIVNRTGTPPEKVTVICNISEINRFSNIPEGGPILSRYTPSGKIVLYAGTLGVVNGIKYLVDLAVETSRIDPEIVFVIVGDGMEKQEVLRYAAERLVLNKQVIFVDPVPKQMLPLLYAECTMGSSFFIPVKAMWANSANKYFDCLAASRPVLINYEGWQAKAITENEAGLVLSPAMSIQDAALALSNHLNDSSTLVQQQKNAIKLAKEEYSLEIAAARYKDVLQAV